MCCLNVYIGLMIYIYKNMNGWWKIREKLGGGAGSVLFECLYCFVYVCIYIEREGEEWCGGIYLCCVK